MGWDVVHRVQVSRWFTKTGDAEPTDIRTVCEDLVLHAPGRQVFVRGAEGKREPAMAYDGILHDHFPDDDGYHVEGVLRLSVIGMVLNGKAQIDYPRACIVYARGPSGKLASLNWMYAERWSVETTLEQLLNTKPAPRAKTIQAEVFQFLSLLYCLMVGYMVRLIIIVHSQDGKFLGEPIRRFSATVLWRFALGLLPRLPR